MRKDLQTAVFEKYYHSEGALNDAIYEIIDEAELWPEYSF